LKLHTDRYCPREKEGIILLSLINFKVKADYGLSPIDGLIQKDHSGSIAAYNKDHSGRIAAYNII
jgi:hypothetical protein